MIDPYLKWTQLVAFSWESIINFGSIKIRPVFLENYKKFVSVKISFIFSRKYKKCWLYQKFWWPRFAWLRLVHLPLIAVNGQDAAI